MSELKGPSVSHSKMGHVATRIKRINCLKELKGPSVCQSKRGHVSIMKGIKHMSELKGPSICQSKMSHVATRIKRINILTEVKDQVSVGGRRAMWLSIKSIMWLLGQSRKMGHHVTVYVL